MAEPVLELALELQRPGSRPLSFTHVTTSPHLVVSGPSGAGKTSLLRAIAGLEPHARGRLVLRGAVLQDDARGVRLPPWERGLGWVPQDAALFPHLRVRENLAYAAPAVPEAELHALAERLELVPLLDRSPRHLSGGERQRVALGRALLARPRLLLLDEPFAALDRPLRRRLAELVRELRTRASLPTLLVTHDPADAAALGDEALTLEDGRLVPGLPPAEGRG